MLRLHTYGLLILLICGFLLKDTLGTCYNGRCRRRCRRHNYYPNGNCGQFVKKISHPGIHKFHSSNGWLNGNQKVYSNNGAFNGHPKVLPDNSRFNHNPYPYNPIVNGQPKFYPNNLRFNDNQQFSLENARQKNIEVIHYYIILSGMGNNCMGPICPDLTQMDSSKTSVVTEQSQSSMSQSRQSSSVSMESSASTASSVSASSAMSSEASESSITVEPEVATPPPDGMSREDSYKAEFESSFSSSNSSKVEGQSSSDSSPTNSNTRYKAEFESNYSNSSSSKVESHSSENKGEDNTEAPTTEEAVTENSLESASIDELLRVLTSKLGVLSSSSSSSSSSESSSESASEQSRRRRDSISTRSNLQNYEILFGDASEIKGLKIDSVDGFKSYPVPTDIQSAIVLTVNKSAGVWRLPNQNVWSYIPQYYIYSNGNQRRLDYGNYRQLQDNQENGGSHDFEGRPNQGSQGHTDDNVQLYGTSYNSLSREISHSNDIVNGRTNDFGKASDDYHDS